MPWVGPIGFESELRVQAAAGDSGSRGADHQTTNDWLSPGSPVNLDTSHAELQETVAKLMGTLDVTKLRLHDAEQVAEAEKANVSAGNADERRPSSTSAGSLRTEDQQCTVQSAVGAVRNRACRL